MSSLKHKGKGPQALTANELREGLNVWLTPDFVWSHKFEDALLTEDADIIEKMQATGAESENANHVVGVYLIDVDPETKLPARYRERFRVHGPSYDTADQVKKA